ncbi:unnamed protein product, partial [Vitis vinifera]
MVKLVNVNSSQFIFIYNSTNKNSNLSCNPPFLNCFLLGKRKWLQEPRQSRRKLMPVSTPFFSENLLRRWMNAWLDYTRASVHSCRWNKGRIWGESKPSEYQRLSQN